MSTLAFTNRPLLRGAIPLAFHENATNGNRIKKHYQGQSNFRNASFVIFGAFLSLLCFIGWQHPSYSMDTLGYAACALSIDENNKSAVHDKTYELARKDIPSQDFEAIKAGSQDQTGGELEVSSGAHNLPLKDGMEIAQRRDLSVNAEHFSEQLPFYWIKPLYVGILYIALRMGMDPMKSEVAIACIACVLTSLLVLQWLKQRLQISVIVTVVLAILMLTTAGMLDIVSLNTPDALSATVLLAAFYFAVNGRNHGLPILLFAIASLLRLDNVLVLILYLSYAYFFAKKQLSGRVALVAGFLTILGFLTIKSLAGFEWGVHFHAAFVQPLIEPAHFVGTVTPIQYLTTIFYAFRMKPPCNADLFFLAMGIAGVVLARVGSLRGNILFHIAVLSFVAAIIHFFIFPEPVPRFFLAHYLVIGIFFIDQVRRVKSFAWQSKIAGQGYLLPAFEGVSSIAKKYPVTTRASS